MKNIIYYNCLILLVVTCLLSVFLCCSESGVRKDEVNEKRGKTSKITKKEKEPELSYENCTNTMKVELSSTGIKTEKNYACIKTSGQFLIKFKNISKEALILYPMENRLYFHIEGLNDGIIKVANTIGHNPPLESGVEYTINADVRAGTGKTINLKHGKYRLNIYTQSGIIGPVPLLAP